MSVVLTRAIRIKFGVDEEVWRGARPDELVGTKYTGNWSLGRAAELDLLATSSWLSPNDGGRPAVPAGNQTLALSCIDTTDSVQNHTEG